MATMVEVAKAAKVSVTTVSHVLNNTRTVKAETRERVLRAIDMTGYRRNALATALVTSRTQAVGVSISAAVNPYFSGLMYAINRRLTELGYSLMMGDAHEDSLMEKTLFDRFLDWQVDGIICAPTTEALEVSLPYLKRSGKPLVLVDRFVDFDCDQLAPDNFDAVKELTTHMIGLGHTKIAVVQGKPGLHSTIERLAGFDAALEDAGLKVPKQYYLEGNSQSEPTRKQVTQLFSRKNRPTALVSLNNAMTIGSLQGLRDLKLQVPDQVALCCFDDFEWSELFHPSLTAVEQDVTTMGNRAIEMLIERMEGYDGPPRRERIPVKIHYRESSGTKL
ncbi:MAG: LacI family DNA-binding transcriptional regulator [Actinomycetaceae bacterium]|nr:LacI family DNA-binding transcriptional regulator [Actinomycetaceae bacterium]